MKQEKLEYLYRFFSVPDVKVLLYDNREKSICKRVVASGLVVFYLSQGSSYYYEFIIFIAMLPFRFQ